MSFSGGVFSKLYSWVTEQATPPIELSKLDAQESDFATGLSNCILRDGTGVPTAATPWNSQRLSSLGTATARADAITTAQVQDFSVCRVGTVAGTNTITGSLTPAITAYAEGMIVTFEPANSTTGAVTINLNSVGAVAIVKETTTALATGDMIAGVPAVLVYNGTAFVLLNPQTSSSRTFSGTVTAGAVTASGAVAGGSVTSGGVAVVTTARTLSVSGTGLTGGGDLSANRTITIDQTAMTTRNITGKAGVTKTLSTSAASGGSDGDIWYRY